MKRRRRSAGTMQARRNRTHQRPSWSHAGAIRREPGALPHLELIRPAGSRFQASGTAPPFPRKKTWPAQVGGSGVLLTLGPFL